MDACATAKNAKLPRFWSEAEITMTDQPLSGEATKRVERMMTPDECENIRRTFTNEVIRAIGALARQQNVCREQAGQVVFVSGMDAAREYLVEHVEKALTPSAR